MSSSWFTSIHRVARRQNCILAALTGVVIIMITIVLGGSPALGQFSLPLSGSPTTQNPPYGVTRLGSIEVTFVKFDGDPLFAIVARTVSDRSQAGGLIPVETRASLIEANLRRVVVSSPMLDGRWRQAMPSAFDATTLQINSATLGGETVLTAVDGDRTKPLNLLTVTQLDADYYGMTVQEVAALWQRTLQAVLTKALQSRQPSVMLERLRSAGLVMLAVLAGNVGVWFIQRFLRRRSKDLQAQEIVLEEEMQTALAVSENQSSVERRLLLLSHSGRRFTLEIRQGAVAFFQWLFVWIQVLTLFWGMMTLLRATPYTQPLAGWLRETPLVALVIWFATGGISWAGNIAIDRMAAAWRKNTFFTIEAAQRRSMRITTTIRAIKGLKTFAVYVIGILNILNVLGLSTGSVLAFGAILGVAISFGSQSLVKDLVNGCLILLEDQYAIGDVISLGSLAGFVENMNLRITQIRDHEGRLITIPNSSIVQVQNLTRSWSRIDFAIEVSYDTDVDQALGVIRQVGETMYADPAWHNRILATPETLGVDNLAHTGILIRVWIQTQPLKQWEVAREFRRRLHIALRDEGIAIGTPQYQLYGASLITGQGLEDGPLPPPAMDGQPTDV